MHHSQTLISVSCEDFFSLSFKFFAIASLNISPGLDSEIFIKIVRANVHTIEINFYPS